MSLKNSITKLKTTKLYKPVMVMGLAGVAVVLVWGSATTARVVLDSSDESSYMAVNNSPSDFSYEYDDEFSDVLTGNAREGTKVSILKREGSEVVETGYANGDNLDATQITGENTNLGQASEMDNLEYNITKQILAELAKDSGTNSSVSTEQMTDLSSKYDVSMAEIENLVKKYQAQNSTNTETIKSELGITEQQLKTMIKQIETTVANNQKTVEAKISSSDKKINEIIANTQTLTDKQIKELSSQLGVSEKDLKDYIDKQTKASLTEAKAYGDSAAKAAASPKADKDYVDTKLDTKIGIDEAKQAASAAASPKADKSYVDNQLSTRVTTQDLQNKNVITATYDDESGTLTFSQVE